ncbi:hypothetical protein NFI95_05775, partial [Acetobacteraceae bacterium KSS8]|nr:hypothetical protein [Acetobacteraceae bacterium KSS8]
YRSASSATGYRSASSATGDQSSASNTGKHGVAMSVGFEGRVMGADGVQLVLNYRDPDTGRILHVWTDIVGRNGIKPNVWYLLNADGKPVELA